MGQIDQFKDYSYSKRPQTNKKPYKKQVNKKCKNEHAMNVIS